MQRFIVYRHEQGALLLLLYGFCCTVLVLLFWFYGFGFTVLVLRFWFCGFGFTVLVLRILVLLSRFGIRAV